MEHSLMISLFCLALLGATFGHTSTSRRTCRLCPPGTHVKHPCTVHSDTICAPCDEGTFTDTHNDLKSCSPCSKCPQTMYTHTPCLNNSDTVCTPCSSVPNIKSQYYVISCEDTETDDTGIELSDIMLADDPGDTNNGDNAENDGTDEGDTRAIEDVKSFNNGRTAEPVSSSDVANEEKKVDHLPPTDPLLHRNSNIGTFNDVDAEDDDQNRLFATTAIIESELEVPESAVDNDATKDVAQGDNDNSSNKNPSDDEENQKEQTESPDTNENNIPKIPTEKNNEDISYGHNDASNESTRVPTDEAAETPDAVVDGDAVINETTSSLLKMPAESDDYSENDLTTLPSLEGGRFEAVRLNVDEEGDEVGKADENDTDTFFALSSLRENSSLFPLSEDVSTATLQNDAASYLSDDAVNDSDPGVTANSQNTTGEVTTLEDLQQSDDLTAHETDGLNTSGVAGDGDLNDHQHDNQQDEPGIGKTQHKNSEDDPVSKKRAAIVIGVAIGGLAFFTLAIFGARCWKRRRGRFKEMKKVNTIDDEAVQLQPLNQSENGNQEEPNVRTTNGLYRKGPKTGPSSPRKQQTEQEKSDVFPHTENNLQTPLVAASPASSDNDSTESPPLHDSLLNSVDKMKYIDDSTDDEYVNYFLNKRPYSRASAHRLSNVAEETPPTSPSFNQ